MCVCNAGATNIVVSLSNLQAYRNRANDGGGVFVHGKASVSATAINVSMNKAIVTATGLHGNGGGVFVGSNTVFQITDGLLLSNWAGVSGGGLYAEDSASVELDGGLARKNAAGACLVCAGGGLAVVRGGQLFATSFVVEQNVAASGGALSVMSSATTTLTDCTIVENSAKNKGGGAFVADNGFLSVLRGTLSTLAAPNGGAVACESNGTVEMTGVTVSNCRCFFTDFSSPFGTVYIHSTMFVLHFFHCGE